MNSSSTSIGGIHMALSRLRATVAILMGVTAIALPTGSVALAVTPDLERAGWQVLAFPGKVETRFIGRSDGAIEVRAESSVALLYREVTPTEGQNQHLSWRWRVEETMPPTDLALKGSDDRPLALHIWFPADPDRTSWWQRLSRVALDLAIDAPVSGKWLTYVWGGTGGRGDSLMNPYSGPDGVIYILRPGNAPTGRWFSETIDIAADFERAFGYPAPAPIYIAISADADDTDGSSVALIADIRFTSG